jgi:hypothetical protein
MRDKYHQLYVPRVMWDDICQESFRFPGLSPKQYVMNCLREHLYGVKVASRPVKTENPFKPHSSEKIIKKTKKKDLVLYIYDGSGPDGFIWEERADFIGELKKFFYKMGHQELFDKCMCDKNALPEGSELEYVADYASQLWEKKQEVHDKAGEYS